MAVYKCVHIFNTYDFVLENFEYGGQAWIRNIYTMNMYNYLNYTCSFIIIDNHNQVHRTHMSI